jgi:hypothetical protein
MAEDLLQRVALIVAEVFAHAAVLQVVVVAMLLRILRSGSERPRMASAAQQLTLES